MINKKKFMQGITVATVLILGALFFHSSPLFCTQAQASCAHSSPSSSKESVEIANNYFTYSDAKLQELLSQHRQVVLYFHAPWCTTCTSFDLEMRESSHTLPEDTVVLQIPFDTATELKQHYNVAYQHTLILLNYDSTIREMWIGGNLDALNEYLSNQK